MELVFLGCCRTEFGVCGSCEICNLLGCLLVGVCLVCFLSVGFTFLIVGFGYLIFLYLDFGFVGLRLLSSFIFSEGLFACL